MIAFSERGEYFLDQCRQFHQAGHKNWTGKPVLQHRKQIRSLVEQTGAKTALDYGCGKGRQFTWPLPLEAEAAPGFRAGEFFAQYIGIPIIGYDPCVPEYAEKPTDRFDLVLCANVLGLVPDGDLPAVIDEVFAFSKKAVFVQLRMTPPTKPGKHLPDGSNGPSGNRDVEFWRRMLKPRRGRKLMLIIEGQEYRA